MIDISHTEQFCPHCLSRLVYVDESYMMDDCDLWWCTNRYCYLDQKVWEIHKYTNEVTGWQETIHE